MYVAVSRLALEHFPHVPPPNPLVTELRRLAGEPLPWVAEVAADIFMGSFVRVFGEAAAHARASLRGTLYARYYDLPEALPGSPPSKDVHLDDTFRAECVRRAGEANRAQPDDARVSFVARNGTVLEQAQILTTQNMATWVSHIGRSEALPHLELAQRCLTAALAGFAPRTRNRNADLRRTKIAAAAWRNMLFWLSLAPDGAVVIDAAPDGALADLRWKGGEIVSRFGRPLPLSAPPVGQWVRFDGGRASARGRP